MVEVENITVSVSLKKIDVETFTVFGTRRDKYINTYIHIYRQCGPVVRLGGLAPARPIIHQRTGSPLY